MLGPDQIKHLEMIQNIITRMNTNSFQIKRMAILVVSAILVFSASDKTPNLALVAIFPLLLFWYLDSFYLNQERKFRGLYNDLVKGNPKKIKPFQMRIDLYTEGEYSFWSAFLSRTICSTYLFVCIAMVLIFLFTN